MDILWQEQKNDFQIKKERNEEEVWKEYIRDSVREVRSRRI